MSNRRKPRKNAPRSTRHLHSVSSIDADAPENQPLMRMLRPALRNDDPIDFLLAISTMVAMTRPSPFAFRGTPDTVPLPALLESLLGVSLRETTAALRVMRELVDDAGARAAIDAELPRRRQPVPPWINALRDAEVTGVINSTEELGDGENIAIGFRIPGYEPITLVAFIDHNLGSVVKDAFPFPGDHVELSTEIRIQSGGDITVTELDGATARARLEGALERADMTMGLPDSETWPQIRTWLEWAIRLLPEGGMDTDGPVLSEHAIAELAEDFARSPEGRRLKYRDTVDMVETLCWLHGDDPMRWSPVVVEILLADRLPRKVVDSPKNMARYPAVLRAFVRYCHRELEISAASTAETLAAIDHFEREFLARINGTAPGGSLTSPLDEYLRRALADGRDPATVMDSIIGRKIDELDYDADYPAANAKAPTKAKAKAEAEAERKAAFEESLRRIHQLIHNGLAAAVGGLDILNALDLAPLPDEPFAWDAVPPDARSQVEAVLPLCDAAADRFFDVEHRTAMRRFLATAAGNDPAIFLRKAAPERLAAAVAWAIAVGNHSAGGHNGATLTVKALLEHFGVKGSITQRARPLLEAVGCADLDYAQGVMSLGDVRFLTSARRRSIAHHRDRTAPGAPL